MSFSPGKFLVLPDAICHHHWKVCQFLAYPYSAYFDLRPSFVFVFHSDWDTSKTWFSNTSTASSGDDNRWARIFFLMCGNKEKSLGAKSGLCGGWPLNSTFWPVEKALVWAVVLKLALSWFKMTRLLLFVFRISPNTLGKQIVVYHSEFTLLLCSSGTVATSPVLSKKQSIWRWYELMCESSYCHGQQWFVFSCSFFEFLRRL